MRSAQHCLMDSPSLGTPMAAVAMTMAVAAVPKAATAMPTVAAEAEAIEEPGKESGRPRRAA